ncbi:MAG TPA: hypothetical protein VFH48_19255 [Chloroflexota bacterium]|nr:hypothetical protein [Chloroflexota bacterium]
MLAKLTARSLLVVLGVLLPLLVLEIAFRVVGPIVPGNYETGVWAEGHPVVGHYHVPGSSTWIREPEFTTHLRFNRYGLRGPELAAQRSSAIPRLLLLGDSFLEAKQVAELDALPYRLDVALQDWQKTSAEMMNAGTFDWSQVHEYLFLQYAGPTLRPNLVIQFFYVGNDVGDLWPRSRGELRDLERPVATVDDDGHLQFPEWRRRTQDQSDLLLGALSRRSTVFRAYETGVVDKLRYRERDGQGIEGQMLELFRFKETPQETRAWKTVEALLLATRNEAERQGARYALVIVPGKWQVHREDWQALIAAHEEPDDDRWVLRGPNRRLAQLAEAHQIPVLDLLPPLREAAGSGRRLYYGVDIHWNAAGHEVAARAVANFLASSGLLR